LGLGDKITYGEGFVICGSPAWLVFLALTMVVHVDDGTNVVYTSHTLHTCIVDVLLARYNIIVHRPCNTTHVVQM
jgi:hypothetical protein